MRTCIVSVWGGLKEVQLITGCDVLVIATLIGAGNGLQRGKKQKYLHRVINFIEVEGAYSGDLWEFEKSDKIISLLAVGQGHW